jgi:hypothetical protein
MNRLQYLLVKLAEECSETAQRCAKALCFGIEEVQPGQPEDNRRRLEREFGEAVAVFEMLGFKIHDEDKVAKRAKVEHFMTYSRQLGTLEHPNQVRCTKATPWDGKTLPVLHEDAEFFGETSILVCPHCDLSWDVGT